MNGRHKTWTLKKEVNVPCFLACNKMMIPGDKVVAFKAGSNFNKATIAHHSCWISRQHQLIAIEGGSNIAAKKIEVAQRQVAEMNSRYDVDNDAPVVIGNIAKVSSASLDYRHEYEKLKSWKEGLEQGLALAKGRE